jgi:hypothetical protein
MARWDERDAVKTLGFPMLIDENYHAAIFIVE